MLGWRLGTCAVRRFVTIDLPDLPVEAVSTSPDDTKAFGDTWLCEQRSPLLRVPSFIVPESSNFLLNPLHPQAVAARITQKREFAFDRRLWLPL